MPLSDGREKLTVAYLKLFLSRPQENNQRHTWLLPNPHQLPFVPTGTPLCQIEEERRESRQDTRLLAQNMHRDGFAEPQCSTEGG
jgi:hypothetical protein